MKTDHQILFSDSKQMKTLSDECVDLVVTSPPYPMIEMWDDQFFQQDSRIKKKMTRGNGFAAFELMHKLLDETWKEVYRVLKYGGFACINIGDATRTVDEDFALYPNHARILQTARQLGFFTLPCILWRKQTNAPNKFMGSGMLPAGAYVTLEHEYILILRKGSKRVFKTGLEKENRQESAFFWEERNNWFSDIWFDIKGTPQKMKSKKSRDRSGAFPFELAYRLINMYSVKNDLVLDPFSGTGTTGLAAMAAARNSVGYEIEPALKDRCLQSKQDIIRFSREVIQKRLAAHIEFVHQRLAAQKVFKYKSTHYGFPVVTNQEKLLLINDPIKIKKTGSTQSRVIYADHPQAEFIQDWPDLSPKNTAGALPDKLRKKPDPQQTLFD